MTGQIRCHYDVLDVPRDADAATIKKSHRKAALKHHPDKNVNKSEEEREASEHEFKLIQAAYECLSDPVERKWYDEHRDMILRGHGLHGRDDDGGDGSSFLYDVVPFQYAGCYDGYDDDDPESFYSVYTEVFEEIFEGEREGYISEGNIDTENMANTHLSEVEFGDSTSDWEDILAFYNTWEGFTSVLSFAWVDVYHLHDIKEAPSRRIRRLMEDDNKKKRKVAKKERVEEVCALVRFVKRRDPRVKAQREKTLREQVIKENNKLKEAAQRKREHAAAREEWRVEAERNMAEQEAEDLSAGRVRLADFDDGYDYGGKRGRKKKGKKKGKKNRDRDSSPDDHHDSIITDTDDNDVVNVDCDNDGKTSNAEDEEDETNVEDDLCNDLNNVDIAASDDISSSEESSEEEEPDSWRCEGCRKDFKSVKQFENHERSKKHKEMLKKYEKKMQKEVLRDMIDEM